MNIAFFGSSLLSAYWNGAATYYRGILRALNERGHRITFYEPDAWQRQQHRDIEPPDYATSVVYSAEDENEVLSMVERAARGADLGRCFRRAARARGARLPERFRSGGVLGRRCSGEPRAHGKRSVRCAARADSAL